MIGCLSALNITHGFLSENPDFSEAVTAAGVVFVGPTTDQLKTFGNKAGARALASELGVPLVPGTNEDTTLEQVLAF